MSRTTQDILTLSRTAADGSLGKTLLRLATLAETLHRHADASDTLNTDQFPVHGRTQGPVAGSEPGSVHREVDR